MTRRPDSRPAGEISTPAALHLLCHSMREPVAVIAVPSGAVLERNAGFRRLFGNPERLSHFGARLRRSIGDKPRILRRLILKTKAGDSIEGTARIIPIPGTFPLQSFFHFSPRRRRVPAADESRLQHLLDDRLEQLKNFERLRSLGEVSAILVHEIRAPLSTIKMAVDTARRTGVDPAAKRQLDNAMEQVGRIDRLLSGIRDYARPYSLDLAAVDAREIVRSALQGLQGTLAAPGTVIELEPDTGTTTVIADRERMIEALTNLVLNAIEAMPAGGKVTVGVAPARRRKGWTEIRVWDEGPGIPADIAERVFQPFFTTKRSGSGLGLSIVKKIVDLHGGFVKLKTAPGKGTLVTIELPAVRREM